MSAAENKAVVRRWFEAINAGNLPLVDELVSPTYVNRGVPPGQPNDLAAFKQTLTMFRAAFPDLQVTVEDLIAEGDQVVVKCTLRGTQQGEFQGLPPSGRPFRVNGLIRYRIVDGKIAEDEPAIDQLGMLQQLGALPTSGQERQAGA